MLRLHASKCKICNVQVNDNAHLYRVKQGSAHAASDVEQMRCNVILPISKGRGVLNYVPAMVHTPADNAPGDSDKDTLHIDLT